MYSSTTASATQQRTPSPSSHPPVPDCLCRGLRSVLVRFDSLASDPAGTLAALVADLRQLEPRLLPSMLSVPPPAEVAAFFDPAMVRHGGGGAKPTSGAPAAGDAAEGAGEASQSGGGGGEVTRSGGGGDDDDAIVPPGTLALYRAMLADPGGVLRAPPPRLSRVAADVLCGTPAVRLKERPLAAAPAADLGADAAAAPLQTAAPAAASALAVPNQNQLPKGLPQPPSATGRKTAIPRGAAARAGAKGGG